MNPVEIVPSLVSDLDAIFDLFELSILYQEKYGYPAWRNYDRGAIVNDIHHRHQYKVVIDSKIAIVFSFYYQDPVIWRGLDQGQSVYLHRIVVNPAFKKQKLFGKVLEWAIADATSKNLESVRMDTWADNPTLIAYYQSFGFRFVENYTTPDSDALPVHNRNLALTLLEYRI